RERFREYYTRTQEISRSRAGDHCYRFASSGRAALPVLRSLRRLRFPAHRVRTSAGVEMAAGEGNAPAYRWIKRTADAAIYSVADRVRITPTAHRSPARSG